MTGRRTHGQSRTPMYVLWMGIRNRCENESHIGYPRYGGSGIKVCKRWLNFSNFIADMGERPKNKSIDRIDPMGDYSPENCRWATAKEQADNKKNAIFLELDGKRMPVTDWSKEIGICVNTIYHRLRKGWGVERVLSPKLFP